MSDLVLRRYEAGDADAVWDLHERALRAVGLYYEEYAHLDADLREIPTAYLDAGGEFLVGEVEGTVVAMGALQPAADAELHEGNDEMGAVRRMRVDPDYQRQGYGSEVLDALEQRAVELGFERLVLDTTEHQDAARALYESFGYEQARREETPIGALFVYEKTLGVE